MATILGIDIGTSAVKLVLVDEAERVIAERDAPLAVSRPRPSWSEQDPLDWWRAVGDLLDGLKRDEAAALAAVGAIGLSGQMHGAVLLGDDDAPLRPAMLWNDGRAAAEARALRASHPHLPAVVGVLPMAGFTGPKIPWLAAHEPDVLARLRTVMMPKDYVRLLLTGEKATDMSDAAGTWWLDEARREWSAEAAEATRLPKSALPRLLESPQPAGALLPELAARWGMGRGVVVAAGAGDAAAGAIGIGSVADGDAFLSLGTSGQLFVTTSHYRPAPETAVHAFAHALPGLWFQMGAMLNGASCLAFAAGLMRAEIETLLAEAERGFAGPSRLIFLPYLTGERTPHDDPHARGVLFGLTPDTTRAEVMQAVLEGVAFSFADARDALAASGTRIGRAAVIGGGARSAFWMRILASVLGVTLARYQGGAKGPAFGAARLGRLALTGEDPARLCAKPAILDETAPDPALHAAYAPRLDAYRRLYAALHPEFRAG
ncbi:xylulokinase [Alsobacter sp. SYSU M60028]|uniref:Xylulose kinase n=1 Tax=Alsobacter ponti TaxID=2962936 RepID=A0ABT1LG79_9HYPH|nr:xylulokinase [Alsobacter ponti]